MLPRQCLDVRFLDIGICKPRHITSLKDEGGPCLFSGCQAPARRQEPQAFPARARAYSPPSANRSERTGKGLQSAPCEASRGPWALLLHGDKTDTARRSAPGLAVSPWAPSMPKRGSQHLAQLAQQPCLLDAWSTKSDCVIYPL